MGFKSYVKLVDWPLAAVVGFASFMYGGDSARKSAEAELERNKYCLETLADTQENLSEANYQLDVCETELERARHFGTDAAVYLINNIRANGDPDKLMRVDDGSDFSKLAWIAENGGVAARRGNNVVVKMAPGNYRLPKSARGELRFMGIELEVLNSEYLPNGVVGEEFPFPVLRVRSN